MSSQIWSSKELYTLFRKCVKLLTKRDQILLVGSVSLQLALIVLDVVGLLLIGSIVAIAASAVQGRELPSFLTNVLLGLNLNDDSPQFVAAILSSLAAFSLILKSALSYYFGLRNFSFLATREAQISKTLASQIFTQTLGKLNRFGISEYQHALTNGASAVMGGVIGQTIALFVEVSLQISMIITLFFFSPLLTLFCLFYFLSLFLILNYVQGNRAKKWGSEMTQADVNSLRIIADAISSYRELTVSGRRDFYRDLIVDSRRIASQLQVNRSMLSQFSKYIFEASVVIAGLGISAFAFATRPAVQASSLVVVFLAAASRISTSVLRLQQGILQLRGAAGATELFFKIYETEYVETRDEIKNIEDSRKIWKTTDTQLCVKLEGVSFSYPGNNYPTLDDVSLQIMSLTSTAVVGASGAGKSTLIDVILGINGPIQGRREIFGLDPTHFHKMKFKGIAYVPQHVHLTANSLMENVAFGLSDEEIDENKVVKLLAQVGLSDWVEKLPNGINSRLGDRGSFLSGGQKQRIGIARALYQEPVLLVLDEATSSLDAESEYEISSLIESMSSEITTIVIAHRLSTVMKCTKIVYLENGKIIGEGNFQELRNLVPNFDRQANLMGIKR